MKEQLEAFLESIGFMTVDIVGFSINDSPLKDGDKVIGEMNEFEINCMVLINEREVERSILEKLQPDLEPFTPEFDTAFKTYRVAKYHIHALSAMVLASIYQRFDNVGPCTLYPCNGNKIASSEVDLSQTNAQS